MPMIMTMISGMYAVDKLLLPDRLRASVLRDAEAEPPCPSSDKFFPPPAALLTSSRFAQVRGAMSTNPVSFPPNSVMPEAYAISQPIADPAAVNDMLDDALCAFYTKCGTVKARPTPLAFAAEDRRATISERAAGMMARDSESPDYVQQLRGRLFLKTTLTRAALSNPILSVLEPAVRNLLVDTLSGVRAMILEAKSEGIPYSVGTATYLYALIDAIALEPRGQDIMDKWVAANLVPVMLALANMPAIRPRCHSAVDRTEEHSTVKYETRAQHASHAPARRDKGVKYEGPRHRDRRPRHGNVKKTTVTVHIHFHAPYPISRALGPSDQAPAAHRAQLPAARFRPARVPALRERGVSFGGSQAYTLAGPSTSVAAPTCATEPAEDLTAPATLYAASIRNPLAMLPAFHNFVDGLEWIPGDFVASTPTVKIYRGAAPLRLP
ncbi:hypothetical protein EV121DRAFT_290999 [Schizophyllum commune]